jgi:hypothetical protein
VSEERAASIFRVEAEQETSMERVARRVDFIHGVLGDPEDIGDISSETSI